MSKDQLFDSYLKGTINRRAFIRGLVGLGMSMSVAASYAVALRPAAAQVGRDYYEFYDNFYEYDMCAHRVTGEIRETRPGGCSRWEQPLELPEDGPLTFCVDRVTGNLRIASPDGTCARGEQAVTLPDEGPITVCVNRITGKVRLSRDGTCSRYEIRRLIGGSSPL